MQKSKGTKWNIVQIRTLVHSCPLLSSQFLSVSATSHEISLHIEDPSFVSTNQGSLHTCILTVFSLRRHTALSSLSPLVPSPLLLFYYFFVAVVLFSEHDHVVWLPPSLNSLCRTS